MKESHLHHDSLNRRNIEHNPHNTRGNLIMTQATIRIHKIVNGGYGLSKLDTGQVILVRHVLPDESVDVTIQEQKKNLLFGQVREIIKCHDDRRTPPCPYFEKCGGCNLQHCHYPLQTAIKKSLLVDLLDRLGGPAVKAAAATVKTVLPAPEEFCYRQRIQLKTGPGRRLGFHGFRSNEVVDISHCLLVHDTMNEVLKLLRSEPAATKLLQQSGGVELLHNPQADRVVAVFQFSRKPRPAELQLATNLCSNSPLLSSICFTGDNFAMIGPVTGSGIATETESPLQITYDDILPKPFTLSWEAGGFCQVNLSQNAAMIRTVLEMAEVTAKDTVLDLFCGMGNFSIPLALQGAVVTGYEGQGAAVRSARKNAELAELTTISFHKESVFTACRQLVAQGRRFNTVVIDPPRHGGPELAKQLHQLTTTQLIYVSCDPATLCRDLNDLTGCGFSIRTIQPIDMFPQTHHIETVVLLTRQ